MDKTHFNIHLKTFKASISIGTSYSITLHKMGFHTMVANYALIAAAVMKPFVDTYDYKPSNILSAYETYIKIKGVKNYV